MQVFCKKNPIATPNTSIQSQADICDGWSQYYLIQTQAVSARADKKLVSKTYVIW